MARSSRYLLVVLALCVAHPSSQVSSAKLEVIYPEGLREYIPEFVYEADSGQPPTFFSTNPPQCPISTTVVDGRKSVCTGALVFNEEFNISELKDLTNWQAEIKFPDEPDYPFNAYIPDGTSSLEDGSLVITPVLTESHYHEGFLRESWNLTQTCTGQLDTYQCRRQASGALILPPVMTGKITTRPRFNFRYGRVEVRAKLPAGSWLIPEINLEPTDNVYGSHHYESGLMRMAFARGNPTQAKKLYGGPVLSDADPFRSMLLKEKIGLDSWFKDYHNYSMIWQPNGIKLLVDGEQYGTIDPGEGFFETAQKHGVQHASNWFKGTPMAPLDQMFYLSLGLRVGGVRDFADDIPDKPWKNHASKAMLQFWTSKDSWLPSWDNASMRVDYIRVFALNSVIRRGQDNYKVRKPKVEAIYPKGFRVILKDDGFAFFGFRANINTEFVGPNKGDINYDSVKPKSGKWIYKNLDEELEIGDTIYYWIYVIKNGKGYINTNFQYTVNEYVKPPQFSEPENELDTKYQASQVACTTSKTVVQGRSSICKDTLIFYEEFDKTSFRALENWNVETKFPGEPDYPFNVYIPDDTLSFENEALVITPVLTDSKYHDGFVYETLDLSIRCTGKIHTEECKQEAFGGQILPPVITAKITTRHSFNFKFGRIEVRAKLPSGSWLMPEINLEPSYHKYGIERYESGLMRIAFTRGNPSLAKRLYGGPVLSDTEPFRSLLLKEKIGIDNWHKDFHNYTLVWKPDGIDLLVDGQQYGTINPGEGFYRLAKENNVDRAEEWLTGSIMAPLDQMFHITLGVRVGGVNDFDDNMEGKPWKNGGSKATLEFWNHKKFWHPSWYNSAMKVDFVKVYAL